MDGYGVLRRSPTQAEAAGSTWSNSGGKIDSGNFTNTWREHSRPWGRSTGRRTDGMSVTKLQVRFKFKFK